MCGIFFLLSGFRPEQIQFKFDPFEYYLNSPYIQRKDKVNIPYYQNIINNNLIIQDISLDQAKNAIQNRVIRRFRDLIALNGQNMSNKLIRNDEQNLYQNQQNSIYEIFAAGSVLNLRGQSVILIIQEKPTIQPIYDKNSKNILLFNGEIYKIQMNNNSNIFNEMENDSLQIFQLFNDFSIEFNNSTNKDEQMYLQNLKNIFETFQGDFSIIFFDQLNQIIFNSNDVFGKRSILLGIHKRGICLSSCAIISKEEIDLQQQNEDEDEGKLLIKDMDNLDKKYMQEYLVQLNKKWLQMPPNSITVINLQESNLRISNFFLDKNRFIYPNTKTEIEKQVPTNFKFQLPEKPIFSQQQQYEAIKLVIIHLEISVQTLISALPPKQSETIHQTQSPIAVLFSGGIDSTIIAHLISKYLPAEHSIDLLSLSFSESSSDRKTSIQSYKELKKLHPNRTFNLILINKTLEDIDKNKLKIIQLIYPKDTHMDFNIANCLNMVSKGYGIHYETREFIQSGSRVQMSGLGADEIFGGYSRYWVAFRRGGYQALKDEMIFDLNRIWIRNLSRDDRAVSDNGRELRFPFLNMDLIHIVQTLDFKILTDFYQEKGKGGEKILLRQAALQMGLKESSGFSKKAMQFGTQLAKVILLLVTKQSMFRIKQQRKRYVCNKMILYNQLFNDQKYLCKNFLFIQHIKIST